MANTTDSSTRDKPVDPRKLLKALVELFNENELRDLCFDLAVDYENLPPGGKKDKVRELILYFHRRRRLTYLVTVFTEKRPSVSLDEIAVDETDEDPTRFDTPIPRAPTAQPQDRSNTVIAGQSFTALIRFLSKPEVRTAVVAFQTDFEAASKQIDLLNEYKLVHDLFQELENRYFLIQNDQRRLPADDYAWENISINEPELQSKITDLLNVMQRVRFTSEERWVQQLDKAKQKVRSGIEEYNLEQLKTGTRIIYRILNRQPSRINAQLVATAKALRLDNLEEAMRTIGTSLSQSEIDLDVVAEIQKGINALGGLDSRLQELVQEHDDWQEIDDELRRVETSLVQGIEELEYTWFDLEPMTRDLINGSDAKWANDLDKVVTSLTDSLEEKVNVTIKRNFRRYRSQVGRRFREVDLELLTLCQDLQRVGESLDLLLRQFDK